MKGYAIANRYAKALFDIGAETGEGSLDRLAGALESLSEAVAASPDLADVLRSPVISSPEKEKTLGRVLNLTNPDLPEAEDRALKSFCAVLAEKNRLPLFPLIAEAFTSMLDAQRRIVRGSVRTAVELDPEKQASIKKRLEETLDGTLNLKYHVDPSILGGLTLKFGNRTLDASLRTQLEALRDTIKKGE